MVYLRHMRGGQLDSGRFMRLWPRARFVSDGSRFGGFTVMEVLIVLGVTALLFFSAAAMIVGRQNRTAFEQSVRNIHSQIQAVIDEVVVGHYPNITGLQCTVTGSGPRITAGSGGQGTNGNCIFMGRVIQFGVGAEPELFRAYTVAGLRLNTANEPVQSLAQAQPILVAPSNAFPDTPDVSITAILENGLTTGSLVYGDGSSQAGGIVIWQSLPAASGSGSLASGAQSVSIGPVTGTSLGMGQQEFVNAANASLVASPLDDPEGIRLCFVSGSTEQSGLITIGKNRRPLEVTLDMKSNRTCS